MKLTAKQQRFVEEYLVDLNSTQAALRAGYSAKSANKIGPELLGKTRITEAIAAAQEARSARVQISQDRVLEELALLSFSDIDHYAIDDLGNMQLTQHAPRCAKRAVASLKKKITHSDYGITYETEIKLWNKPGSIRMVGEHLGMLDGSGKSSGDTQAKHREQQSAAQRLKDHMGKLRDRRQRLEGTIPDESLTDRRTGSSEP